jgi:hypothetical protein
MQENDFKRFIDKVEQLKEKRSDNFNQKDLEEVATELGLNSNDLAAASKRACDCRTRAQRFIDRNLADDALLELKEAIALAPWEQETFFLQALAHEIKWKEGNKESLPLAINLCRQCIEKDSGFEPAYDCMARLKEPLTKPSRSSRKKTNLPGLFVICVAAIVAYNFEEVQPVSLEVQRTRISEQTKAPDQTPVPEQTQVPEQTELPQRPQTKSAIVDLTLNNGSLFPITLVPEVPAPGISLSSYESELKYGYHSLKIKLTNVGLYEYSKLQGSLAYLDKEGNMVDNTRKLTLLDTYQGIIRPGDSFTQSTTLSMKELPVQPSSARIIITVVEKLKAPELYGETKEIKLLWKTDRPSHLNLSASIRNKQISDITYLKDVTKQSILEVVFENTGSGSFRTIAYVTNYTGKNKELFTGTRKLLVNSSSLPLPPGEKRVNRIYDKLTFEPEEISISIVDLK